jgi:sugar phosphate isomerase/epimerase
VIPHAKALEDDIFRRLGRVSPPALRSLVARRAAGDLEPAIGTTFDYSVEIGDMMAAVGEAGFRSVSLAGGNVEHSGYGSVAGLQRLAGLQASTGVGITSVHAPFRHDMASPDSSTRESAVRDVLMAARAAAALGAGVVIVHPHSRLETVDEETMRTIICSIGSILDGVPPDVRIAVENLPSLCSPAALEALLNEFPQDRVGFCYDSSHHSLRPRQFDFLGAFGDRLICVHISDNQGEQDDHQIPGEGVIDWHDFASRFGRLRYREPFLLEVETRESSRKEARVFLTEAFARAEWLMALSDRLGVLS